MCVVYRLAMLPENMEKLGILKVIRENRKFGDMCFCLVFMVCCCVLCDEIIDVQWFNLFRNSD